MNPASANDDDPPPDGMDQRIVELITRPPTDAESAIIFGGVDALSRSDEEQPGTMVAFPDRNSRERVCGRMSSWSQRSPLTFNHIYNRGLEH